MRDLLSWMILTCCLGATGVGAAQDVPPAPAEEARQQARALFERATQSYNVGRFDDALRDYTAAYDLYPAPKLLFNIGQVHRQLGNHRDAVFFLRGYLRDAEERENRRLAEQLLTEEETAVEREREQARLRTGPVAPPPAEGPGLHERWWFWAAISVVAVGGIAAVALVSSGDDTVVLPAGSLGTLDYR